MSKIPSFIEPRVKNCRAACRFAAGDTQLFYREKQHMQF